ncbi:MAG: gliding motility-associated C-terminal domain-containing protein [Ferruginibacter sp.]
MKMKINLLLLFLFVITIIFCSCKKSGNDEVHHISCENLLTDTAGTFENARIYLPTAFTPNNDGRNDIARPFRYDISSFVFAIYDRTNALVYTTSQAGDGWNAPISANTATVYYYRIQAITNSNHHIAMCGELNYLICRPSSNQLTDFYFEDQLTSAGFSGTTGENLAVCP